MLIQREIENFYNLKWLSKFLVGHNGIIAGGCFKNIFNNQPVKDIDVFFRCEEDFIKAKKYFKSHRDLYYDYYENKKVIAFKQNDFYANKDITIELINTIYGEPSDILNAFDFSITKFAYFNESVKQDDDSVKNEVKILHHDKFFEHLHNKRLVIDDKLPFPVSTFERMLRYAKYGYFPCKETKIKLLTAIREAENLDGLSSSLYDGMD